MREKIAIVDYGMGNLHSVAKAMERVAPQADIIVTDNADNIRNADRVVCPGQGAMPDCMRAMEQHGVRDAILDVARNKPFLGLCIGLQMLFESSEEGNVPGLGILPGRVRRFPKQTESHVQDIKLKVPHMGWNQVQQRRLHPLWDGIENNARFYYVHSYYVETEDPSLVTGTTDYFFPFTCAIGRKNVFAVQFHPEKSQNAGLRLLSNFARWQPDNE